MNVESGGDPGEDDAGLALVVGNITGVLDVLREIDFRNVELSDFGYKLRVKRMSVPSAIGKAMGLLT